jgi:putative ABC transport system permease protein
LVLFRTPNMPRRVAIPKEINRDRELQLQAVAPAEEVTKLFEGIVGNIQWILLFLAILIVIVAGIGILVSIYNSMSDRRHEIAIMRALGARRVTVMMIVLCESILLALGGGAIGVLMGHGLTGLLAPVIAQQTGVIVSPLQFQTTELVLIPGLILLATVVGYLPAVVAYRTDVAQSLIASP